MLSTIRMKKSEGFTLIELMIVIAIIGILAAVAIPQFSAYRIRGFNSSALSDARGGNTIESAFYADYSQFGTTIASTSTTTDPVTLPNNAGLSQGSRLTGPQAANNVPYIGALMGTTHRFSSLPLGNLVSIKANTILTGANFLLQTKHEKGDTMYGLVDRSSAVYYLEDKTSAGDPMSSTLVVLGSTPSTLNPFANTTTWAVR